MTKVVDENKMIIKPCIYARHKKLYKIGHRGYFRSSGYEIVGTVQEVIEVDTFQGYVIYLIEKYTKLVWVGIEMTQEEKEKLEKQNERDRRIKERNLKSQANKST